MNILHIFLNNIQEFHRQQGRDKFKEQRCKEEDVYLIIIPYQYNFYNEEELYEYIDEKIREWQNKMDQ